MRRYPRHQDPAGRLFTGAIRRLMLVLLALGGAACAADDGRQRVVLVTTTTVEDSGLLDALVRAYHAAQDDYRLSTAAVGSGAALTLGRRGDADLLLTHDSIGEARLAADGHAAEQGPVMHSTFVVAGPASDPAGIRGAQDLATALARIARSGEPFVSRADDSGTYRRELELWRRAGLDPATFGAGGPRGPRYIEAGAGMAETLRLADQRSAYLLTDRPTWLNLRDDLDLELLARGDPPEPNPYRFTLPQSAETSAGARDFLAWLLGPGQAVIGGYGVERFGEPLFQPERSP